MPARAGDVTIPAQTWVEATDGAISGNIFVQNKGAFAVLVAATEDSDLAADATTDGRAELLPGKDYLGAISDWFLATPSANRLWLWCDVQTAVTVHHG